MDINKDRQHAGLHKSAGSNMLFKKLTCINCVAILILLLVSFYSQQANSFYRDYYTHMHEAAWKVQRTGMECRLQHKIDHYGVATFSLHAIDGITFRLKVLRRSILKHNAELNAVPSVWKHNGQSRSLARITLYKGISQFRLNRFVSVKMLAELEKGMEPTFSFYAKPSPDDRVTVKLSVVHFREAYRKFLHCGTNLAQYKLGDINNKTLYFNTAKFNVSSKYNKDLDKIAAYALYNENVQKIVIEGHTDIIGSHGYNVKLSKNRAIAVRRYLIKRKVPRNKIVIRYYGKRRPVASNYSKMGRAKNRRSKVKIIKH